VTDLNGGLASFIRKSKQCTVKQVESMSCFLISTFTMYADANAIARASLALNDGVSGFDELYRTLTILLFVASFMSTVWSFSVYVWSKMIEEQHCEKEEDTPLGMEETVTERVASAARRLVAPQPLAEDTEKLTL
jgi:hypothetical protein